MFKALLMTPSLAFEHLEHGDLLRIKRIAFDLLELHGFQAPLAGDLHFLGGQFHGPDISQMAEKIHHFGFVTRLEVRLIRPPSFSKVEVPESTRSMP